MVIADRHKHVHVSKLILDFQIHLKKRAVTVVMVVLDTWGGGVCLKGHTTRSSMQNTYMTYTFICLPSWQLYTLTKSVLGKAMLVHFMSYRALKAACNLQWDTALNGTRISITTRNYKRTKETQLNVYIWVIRPTCYLLRSWARSNNGHDHGDTSLNFSATRTNCGRMPTHITMTSGCSFVRFLDFRQVAASCTALS